MVSNLSLVIDDVLVEGEGTAGVGNRSGVGSVDVLLGGLGLVLGVRNLGGEVRRDRQTEGRDH